MPISAAPIVKKPVFGREGHNVTLVGPGLFDTAGGELRQRGLSSGRPTTPLPVFDGNHAVVGSWVIEGQAGRHRHARGRAAHHSQ